MQLFLSTTELFPSVLVMTKLARCFLSIIVVPVYWCSLAVVITWSILTWPTSQFTEVYQRYFYLLLILKNLTLTFSVRKSKVDFCKWITIPSTMHPCKKKVQKCCISWWWFMMFVSFSVCSWQRLRGNWEWDGGTESSLPARRQTLTLSTSGRSIWQGGNTHYRSWWRVTRNKVPTDMIFRR